MKHKKKQHKNRTKKEKVPPDEDSCDSWIERVRFESISTTEDDDIPSCNSDPSLAILSWNVLAESYCSPRSHRRLPSSYSKIVFSPRKRRYCLSMTLRRIARETDVVCLQEVDHHVAAVVEETLMPMGFTDSCETERARNGGRIASKVDSCAIYVKGDEWELVEHESIGLNDLATLGVSSSTETSTFNNGSINSRTIDAFSNIHGIQQAFLRHNMALLARLRHVATGRTVVVANAHLYWNPDYEYVKLCQAHYILQRLKTFRTAEEPIFLCGDLNSKPTSITYKYLSRGYLAAKRLAPWYTAPSALLSRSSDEAAMESSDTMEIDENNSSNDDLIRDIGLLSLDYDEENNDGNTQGPPQMRYLLDFTLNKFCRWLRILGLDVALETEEEEKQRTKEGKMLLFEKCRREQRTLITTSRRLTQRKDCPSSVYYINGSTSPNLEVNLVHLLLTHGVVLQPKTFLTRCVVCNGSISGVDDVQEAKSILEKHQAPTDLIGTRDNDMNVYQCDGCSQGYWFSDRPNSSASRVMATATRLFELCLRGGIPCQGDIGAFDHVDVEEVKSIGWDWSVQGSEMLSDTLQVLEWINSDRLECPFRLESVYTRRGPSGQVIGESLSFTNVTSDFVNTLDYIFFEKDAAKLVERLYVPTSFPELNPRKIGNGHLLPSDIWPSDHLAIGGRFILPPPSFCLPIKIEDSSVPGDNGVNEEKVGKVSEPHGERCGCGCVPKIPSLFEMAELRRLARLKAKEAAVAQI